MAYLYKLRGMIKVAIIAYSYAIQFIFLFVEDIDNKF